MNKIVIEQLNEVVLTEFKEVDILGNKVLIKTYLPIEEKLEIVEAVMQNAIEFNFVNPIKVETYFHVYLAIKYTNIDFSEHLSDIPKLYDIINKAGIVQAIVDHAHADYDELWEQCTLFVDKYEGYQNSLYGVITQLFQDIPKQLEKALDDLGRLDIEKLQTVMNEVSANGGNTNAIIQSIVGKGQE